MRRLLRPDRTGPPTAWKPSGKTVTHFPAEPNRLANGRQGPALGARNGLNRVRLTDAEFRRLPDKVVTPDVAAAPAAFRGRNGFTRDDGTPLNDTPLDTADGCKNTFEVARQLRIKTNNSHHRYHVLLLVNGVPAVQIELRTPGIRPRRAIE